jgi:hypothetical protein
LVVIDEIIEIACACARNAISALRHIMPMASGIALASTIGKLAFVSGFTISLSLCLVRTRKPAERESAWTHAPKSEQTLLREDANLATGAFIDALGFSIGQGTRVRACSRAH